MQPRFWLTIRGFRFSSPLSRRFKPSSVRTLYGIGAYREASSLIGHKELRVASTDVRYAVVRSRFELGEFDKARMVALGADEDDLAALSDLAFLKAMLDIIAGDEIAAIDSLYWACRGNLHLTRPHQNIAARPASKYVPNSLDFLCGIPGRLYDLCNFAGQRVTHVGRGEVGIRLFQRALDAQAELRSMRPPLSPELAAAPSDVGGAA